MNKYAQIAINTVKICMDNDLDPSKVWLEEAAKFYPPNSGAITKSAPKGTFLGLCEAGLIKGIQPKSYTSAKKNKMYGIKAVEIIRKDCKFAKSPRMLWKMINPEGLGYGCQMEVVCALYKAGFINI